MNYKMPKNQSHYIPGSNPMGNPAVPSLKSKKSTKKQEQMKKQLMQAQEKLMSLYARRLTKKDRELLHDFIVKQYRVGSHIFNGLPPILKELILKLNLEGVQVMRSYTKNPFMRIYLSFSAWSLKSLLANLSRPKVKSKKAPKTLPNAKAKANKNTATAPEKIKKRLSATKT